VLGREDNIIDFCEMKYASDEYASLLQSVVTMEELVAM
jgi:hypothetical protein